jgi:fibronectin-binding autotransporter adhesin
VATFAASKTAFTSTADFSGGTLDAKVTTLTIAQATTGVQTGRTGVQTSAFTMGSGTLDAASIVVGRITGGTAGTVATGTFAARGTLSIASPTALVRVTSLTLAENSILGTGTTGSVKAVSGTVSLSAGTLQAGSIARGAQTGNADSVSAGLAWSGGVITNLTGSDLAIDGVPITVASGTGTFVASGANTISVTAASPIAGDGALVKAGSGTLLFGSTNSYSGPTAVDAGTLVVNGINGGTGVVTIAAGATLAGTGTVGGATTIGSGATLSPGASPGTLSFGGGLTWNAGGNYNWQLLSGTGSAGAADAWDLASVTGTLAIASTSADPFKVNLWTLSGVSPDVSGNAANFDASQNYTWRIASAAGGITGFAADKFAIVTGATNGTGGFANAVSGGTFSIAQSGNDLNLVFTASGPSVITINVPSGTQTQTQAGYPTLSGSIPVVKIGGGTLVVDQANTLSGSTTVQGGVLQLANGSALSASRLVVVAGGTGQVAPYTSTSVAGLDLASGNGLMDLTSGALTISSGLTATELVAEILEGRGDGSWTGTSGITSSTAAAESAAGTPRAVGWIDNGDGSLTAAYAAPGDTNVDWSIDILDAANFLSGGKFDTGSPAVWFEGDFSYDGIVDILDAADFFATGLYDAGNYNTAPGLSGGIAAVPEPGTSGLIVLGLAAAAAAARRRRG